MKRWLHSLWTGVIFSTALSVWVDAGAALENAGLLSGIGPCQVGLASGLSLMGPDWVPLLSGGEKSRVAVAAAGTFGRGRLLVFGHSAPFEKEFDGGTDTGLLLQNTLAWMGGPRPRVVVHRFPKLLAWLERQGIDALDGTRDWRTALKDATVLIGGIQLLSEPGDEEALRDFLKQGGGFMTGTCAWGWAQLNPGKTVREDLPLNRFLFETGLVWNEEIVAAPGRGFLPGSDRLLSAHHALEDLKKGRLSAQGEASVLAAVRALPNQGGAFMAELLESLGADAGSFPTEKQPMVRGRQGRGRLAVAVQEARWRQTADGSEAPAAVDFPGAVPLDARPVERTVTVDGAVPDWHGTGLYAAPGAVLTVTIPRELVKKKWAVRIGAHTDHLWDLDKWTRWPALSRAVTLAAVTTRVSNPFGGAVYVVVPKSDRGEVHDIRLSGAVEAPRFVLGKTSAMEWMALRKAPGPWADLEGTHIILTVPSEVVRDLEDPEALLAFWDHAVHQEDMLAGWETEQRKRPERFVLDRQISAGYMHSGYPIMAHLDVMRDQVTLGRIRGTPEKPGGWGQWHELGHNHQNPWWTPSGQGEVTCNLFSLSIQMEILGAKVDACWGGTMAAEKRRGKIDSYLTDARITPATWDPATGLIFYWQFIDGFGFDTLRRVLAGYRTDPPSGEARGDGEKWDQWLTRTSRESGRDLGPQFRAWRIPVTERALAEASRCGKPWVHPEMAR